MSSIFTKLISGEIPSYKIAENDDFFVFLDINPNAKGHTLVVPKKEVNRLFELEDASYAALMMYSKKIAVALEKAVDCKRIGMTVIGLEVPHVHVHLIPLNTMDDATFGKKISMEPEDFKALATKIASFL
ncbi:MAG: HIT family protein [Flavobacteriaceae bacterium]|nr:MAG: HIT family protein [Flavobacteriaceae bacterium]